MTSRGVLVVARDAGAASALAPVVATLIEEGTFRPHVVAWSNALAVFDAEGLPVHAFPVDAGPADIAALLAAVGAAAVVSGTSLQAELDARFWAAARNAGIPSIALLDHWKNYAERFTVEAPFDVLPTVVAVMDDVAERELIARGCPPDRIRVTGQPRFDALLGPAAPDVRSRARAVLGIEPSRPVAVFASQPRGAPYDDADAVTQAKAIEVFLDGVQAASPDVLAVVKLHPIEELEPVAAALAGRTGPETAVLRACPIRELASAADLFCGVDSIVLLDAALLGVPTLSIRPCGENSHFVEVHSGLIRTAATVDEVRVALDEAVLQGHAPPATTFALGAAARVRTELNELVGAAGIMSP